MLNATAVALEDYAGAGVCEVGVNAFATGSLGNAPRLEPHVLFAPDTPQSVIEAYEREHRELGLDGQEQPPPFEEFSFNDGNRWSSTATNGSAPNQGQPITLTWSIVPDGTSIYGYNGEGSASSNLRARLDSVFGSINVWLSRFQQVFDRWSELTGISYVYEPNDDGAAWTSTSIPGGRLGVRGDVRIAGHTIDGGSGILAYNFFPNWGDMVLDTSDIASGRFLGSSLGLRNVVAHEAGHGLGFGHVNPTSRTKLMEPRATSAFDGPQFDDILAAHRAYGDRFEKNGGNDTVARAADLGPLGFGQSLIVGAHATNTLVSPSEFDFVSIDDNSDVDYYAFTVSAGAQVDFTLTPRGPSYESNDAMFNSAAQSDLSLTVLTADGLTTLASSDLAGLGVGESLTDVALPAAGEYLVRVGGSHNKAQFYQLQMTANSVAPPAITGAVWDDVDGDGVRDAAEVGRANVTVYLDANQNGQFDAGETTTTTDASGAYTFSSLPTGTHTVAIVTPQGYEITAPVTDIQDFVDAERVAAGLSSPLFATAPPGDADRLFIVEKNSGRIKILNLNNNTINSTPFLTIPNISTTSEQGLLGLAFDPNYASNGRFYVYYTAASSGASVIARYTVSANPDVADPNSAVTLLTFAQPQANHNGGWMGFGADGMLYIASGDGGGSDDNDAGHTSGTGNAQDITNNLLGKILRIDPRDDDFPADPNRNYAIPADNPFVGVTGDDEIWSYGLRNPWRPSFDRQTGDLYIADVGQSAREEINFQPANSNGGENYGWRLREGTIATPTGGVGGPKPAGAIDPVYDYTHGSGASQGNSVTGGYAYRGSIPFLQGKYFFGDFVNSRIWSLEHNGATTTEFLDWTTALTPDAGTIDNISSFGEDAGGNLYIVDFGGEVFRVVHNGLPGTHQVTLDASTVAGNIDFGIRQPFIREGHWKFDETSGTTAADSAGGDNPGTLVGGAFVNDPQRGQVVRLTNINDRVTVSPAVDLGAQWTIAGWYKDLAPATTWRTLTRGEGGDHQILVSTTGLLGSYDNVGNTKFRSSGFNVHNLPAGWHHVAAVGANGSTTFYVDGVAVGTIPFQSTTDVAALGNHVVGQNRFADFVDDLRVYDRALAAGEIADLVNPGPQAPVAGNDAYSAVAEQTLTVTAPGVLANDTDANGDALTAVLVNAPGHASAFTLNADGSFSYTPAAGFSGVDTFTYRANDGTLNSDLATVTITVSAAESGLVGHWKFDETSGTTAADSAGGDNPGALVGGSFVNDPQRGQVVRLTNINDRVTVSPAVDLSAQWTIAGWYKDLAPATTWRTLTRGEGGDHQILVSTTGLLGSYDNVGNTKFRSSGFNVHNLPAGWHHVAAVGANGSTTFYVDGVAVGTIPFQSTTDVAALGNHVVGQNRFADFVDDLRVYDRALAAGEIAALADSISQAIASIGNALALDQTNAYRSPLAASTPDELAGRDSGVRKSEENALASAELSHLRAQVVGTASSSAMEPSQSTATAVDAVFAELASNEFDGEESLNFAWRK